MFPSRLSKASLQLFQLITNNNNFFPRSLIRSPFAAVSSFPTLSSSLSLSRSSFSSSSKLSSSSPASSNTVSTILSDGRDLLLRLRSLTPAASSLSLAVFDKIKLREDEVLLNNHLLDGYSSLTTLSDWIRFVTALFHRRFESKNLQQTSKSAIEDAHLLIFGVLGLPFALADISLHYILSASSSTSPPFLSSPLTSSERSLLFFAVYCRLFYNIPSAYIAGRTQYCTMEFLVDERAIIPRSFIGEFLMMEAEKYQQMNLSQGQEEEEQQSSVLFELNGLPFFEVSSILDLCTGNGSLAIIASRVFRNAAIDAVDISPLALEVAKANIVKHYSITHNRIQLFQGDLFEGLNNLSISFSPSTPHSSLTRPHPVAAQKKYEIILCNPPYLSSDRMAALSEEYLSEPSVALAGGSGDHYNGLELPARIIENAGNYLESNGVLIIELSGHTEEAIEKLLTNYYWKYLEMSDGSIGHLVIIHKLNGRWKKDEKTQIKKGEEAKTTTEKRSKKSKKVSEADN